MSSSHAQLWQLLQQVSLFFYHIVFFINSIIFYCRSLVHLISISSFYRFYSKATHPSCKEQWCTVMLSSMLVIKPVLKGEHIFKIDFFWWGGSLKSCQKVDEKISKSCRKVVQKISDSSPKVVKSC